MRRYSIHQPHDLWQPTTDSSKVAAECKWKNMATGVNPALDDEQYYLFKKTDNTKWRILRPYRKATPTTGSSHRDYSSIKMAV